MELLKDRYFKNGFYIGHVDALISRNPIGTWSTINNEKPDWKLCQWCTNHNLLDGKKSYTDNIYTFKNKAKNVTVNYKDNTILLEVLAQNEYLSPRVENEGWPHLLLEQEFSNMFVSGFKRFEINIDVVFDYFKDYMGNEKNNLHTCQFQWFFAIGKKNKQTNEVDDFFWFGLGISDYPRYSFVPPYQAVDGGKEENTNKFIYIIDSKKYLTTPCVPNTGIVIKYDVKDELADAFKTAKEKGYLKDVLFDDLEIVSTNIGIEMTGTFHAKYIIRSISVKI